MTKEIVYKLTTSDGYTRKGEKNQLKWGEDVTHSAKGKGGLCSDGVIHAYTSPLLAVLLNPIHANIYNPTLWEGEMVVTHRDKSLKVGGKTMTTLRKISLPEVSTRQRVIFAILCAKEALKTAGLKEEKWEQWANDYIEGRSDADAARYAAASAAASAAYGTSAARYSADAARYAAYAADAAASAAASVYSAYSAAYSAAYAAAYSARSAAYADADAVYYAAYAARFDLNQLALQAISLGAE